MIHKEATYPEYDNIESLGATQRYSVDKTLADDDDEWEDDVQCWNSLEIIGNPQPCWREVVNIIIRVLRKLNHFRMECQTRPT